MGGPMIHCSYHKCLTVDYSKVVRGIYHKVLRDRLGSHRHFNSLVDDFYEAAGSLRSASVNNHCIDLDRIPPDAKVSRFVRDPRDLVVSGYFYHRRGAEDWCTIVDPTPADWRIVNGAVPPVLRPGDSLTSYLQRVDVESGLIAEMMFRRHHFDSMAQWPGDDPRIEVFRYEDIVGNEGATFDALLAHHGRSWPERQIGRRLAERYRARPEQASGHVRDPRAGQWQEVFTDGATAAFGEMYGDLLARLGYGS